MKTVEELIKEIEGSQELQKAMAEINDAADLDEFLKKNGCAATADEFMKFVESQAEGEIADDAVAEIAGGAHLVRTVVMRTREGQAPLPKLIQL